MEIPSKLYYLVGFAIISNIGIICSMVWLGLTMSWKLSERFTKLEARDDAIDTKAGLAHGRIDKIESKVWR